MTPDFNTMTPAHIHCRTTAVRSCGTARSSYHANAMQMTRRAVETAKDITCAYCVSVGVGNSYESTEKSEIIDASVEMATMLIEKLKRIQKI